jgi:hypothetical protein
MNNYKFTQKRRFEERKLEQPVPIHVEAFADQH